MKILNKSETIAAIAGITIIELYALYQGIDGILLTFVIATLSGLGGYKFKNVLGNSKV